MAVQSRLILHPRMDCEAKPGCGGRVQSAAVLLGWVHLAHADSLLSHKDRKWSFPLAEHSSQSLYSPASEQMFQNELTVEPSSLFPVRIKLSVWEGDPDAPLGRGSLPCKGCSSLQKASSLSRSSENKDLKCPGKHVPKAPNVPLLYDHSYI